MATVDLNCDLGEGAGLDAALMPLVTSANIACGAHAGDARTMRETVALAQKHGVAIGAHPGFADRGNFGRSEVKLGRAEMFDLVSIQIATLAAMARLHHVKAHGALYNLAARDAAAAEIVAVAVKGFDPALQLYALAGSQLARAGRACGLRVIEEVFADRTYQPDGSLTARTEPNAMITDEAKAAEQAVQMLRTGKVRAVNGVEIPIRAGTICLHGDGPHAVAFARRVREELSRAGNRLRAP